MSTRINETLYNKLLEAYQNQSSISSPKAADAAGCDVRTARRYFNVGWPPRFPPIKSLLCADRFDIREEFVLKQEAIVEKQKAKLELARQNAIAEQVTEAVLVKSTKYNAQTLLEMANSLLEGGFKLAQKVSKVLNHQEDINVKESTQLLTMISKITAQASEVAKTAIELERLHMGDPTAIVKHSIDSLTDTEVAERIEAAQRAIDRARNSGFLPDPKGAQEAEVISDEVPIPR